MTPPRFLIRGICYTCWLFALLFAIDARAERFTFPEITPISPVFPGESQDGVWIEDFDLDVKYDARGRITDFTFSGVYNQPDGYYSQGPIPFQLTGSRALTDVSGGVSYPGSFSHSFSPAMARGKLSGTMNGVTVASFSNGPYATGFVHFTYNSDRWDEVPGKLLVILSFDIYNDPEGRAEGYAMFVLDYMPGNGGGETIPKPEISAPEEEVMTVGEYAEFWIDATNHPTSYGATGLPPGMSCDKLTGKISGTPTKVGNFKVTYSATNAGGTGKKTLIYRVLMAAPQFVEHPQDQEVRVGDWIQLSSLATPDSLNSYQWWSYADRFSSDSYANEISRATQRILRLVADWDLVGRYYCEATNSAGFDRSETAEVGVFDVLDRHITVFLQDPGITDTDDYIFLEDGIAASVPLKAMDFFFVSHDRFGDTYQVQPDYLYAIPGRLVPASSDTRTNLFDETYYRAHTTKTNEIWLPAGFVRAGSLWMSELTFGGYWRNSSTNEIIGIYYDFNYTFVAETDQELELTFGINDSRGGQVVIQFHGGQMAWTVDWDTGGEAMRWPVDAVLEGADDHVTGRLVGTGVGGLVQPGTGNWSSPDLDVEQSRLDEASLPFSFIDNEKFHDDHPWVGAADSPLFLLNQIGSASMQLPVQTVKRAGWPHFQTPLFDRPDEHYLPELKPEMSASLWLRWYAVVEDPRVADWRVEAPVIDEVLLRMGLLRTPVRYVGLTTAWSGGLPEEIRASELPDFSDTDWKPFERDSAILLSEGSGTKTVYVQLRNAAGTSAIKSASIRLASPGEDNGGAFAEITVAPGAVSWVFNQSLADILPGEEYKIKGLPAGMRLNKLTGEISGFPLKAGEYRVSIQVRNGRSWSQPVFTVIQVDPLPSYLVGTFWGSILPDEPANNGLGGQARLTIADTGLFSAEIISGKTKKSFRGRIDWDAYGDPVARFYSISGDYAYSAGLISPHPDGTIEGFAGEWLNEAPLAGWKTAWNSKTNPAPALLTGPFNLLLIPQPEVFEVATQPHGIGLAMAAISSSGYAKWALISPDGRKSTAATPIGPHGEIGAWGLLDKGLGFMAVTAVIDGDGLIDGFAEWFLHPTDGSAYPDGVGLPGAPENLEARGARYSPPDSLLFGLHVEPGNAELAFLGGGLLTDETLAVSLGESNKPEIPKAKSIDNPVALALKLNLKTGLFTGSRTFSGLVDDRSDRKGTFTGLLVPERGLGGGHFLIPTDNRSRTSGTLLFGPPEVGSTVFENR
ncbi:MAG: hypothetical protein Fur0032_08760 [Terrimicrobiaceae bacterium]